MTRRLFKSSRYAPKQARDLIEAIFAAELIDPSDSLWVVSPWISDFAVLDNTARSFSGIDPNWGARTILLSEVIAKLASLGCDVKVVTRPDDLNASFVRRLRNLNRRGEPLLAVIERTHLHEKGILGDDFHLGGSMNLTFMGVEINEEALVFETDPDAVARARREYELRYQTGQDGGKN